MEDAEEPLDEDVAVELDAVGAVMALLADFDTSALVTGFILLAESIEEDGSTTLMQIHTPMAPWHREGLLRHAIRWDPYAPGNQLLDDEDCGDDDC